MTVNIAGIRACVAGLATAPPTRGEHEIYYRYTVLGYVEDGAGKPRANASVQLVREKTGFAYRVSSDAAGLYVLVARLGDESVGERLQLRVDGQELMITARFDPADRDRERGTRVDFVRGQPVERAPEFQATLRRVLAN